LISLIFNHVAGAGAVASDSSADFFRKARFAIYQAAGRNLNRRDLAMTSIAPFIRQLSVVAAYLAFAFVGAIVLGMF
jgi:hypothetical protein